MKGEKVERLLRWVVKERPAAPYFEKLIFRLIKPSNTYDVGATTAHLP